MDDILKSLNMVGMYMATVIAGLLIHAIIIIPVLYLIVVHKNPLRYFLGLRDAIITAFGTSSRCVRVGNREPNVSFFITVCCNSQTWSICNFSTQCLYIFQQIGREYRSFSLLAREGSEGLQETGSEGHYCGQEVRKKCPNANIKFNT